MSQATAPPSVHRFDLPPAVVNVAGRVRTVGVELEFIGPTAEEAAHALADALGGTIVQDDPHAFRVTGSTLGDLQVALDTRFAHPAPEQAGPLGGLSTTLASWFGSAAGYLVPCELVTAPLPMDRLAEADRIPEVLRAAGARGTQDGALYAFGLHFNPEAPRLDVAGILPILKAFVLLNAWLRRETAPDATRQLLGFANPFPEPYVRRILSPDYAPDLAAFIDDYLAANPTRNRDLDLLPLLLHLDEARVRAVLPAEKIGGRPTFHYRLPDARVSDPAWSLAPDWNLWVAVERLASDIHRLDALASAYRAGEGDPQPCGDPIVRAGEG